MPPYAAARDFDRTSTACVSPLGGAVAVNNNPADSRNKYTVLLAMTSRAAVPIPVPVVVFSSSAKKETPGKRIRAHLEAQGAPKGVPLLFTESGNTQAQMLNFTWLGALWKRG